jgi:hypothetical protein
MAQGLPEQTPSRHGCAYGATASAVYGYAGLWALAVRRRYRLIDFDASQPAREHAMRKRDPKGGAALSGNMVSPLVNGYFARSYFNTLLVMSCRDALPRFR